MDGALFVFYGDMVKSTIRQNGLVYSNDDYLPKCDAANLKPSPSKPDSRVHVPYGGGLVDGRHLRTIGNFSINCDFQFNCYCNNFFSLDLKPQQQHLHQQQQRLKCCCRLAETAALWEELSVSLNICSLLVLPLLFKASSGFLLHTVF